MMERTRCFAPGCLAFADHVDVFVTGNRASGAPKGTKPLTGTGPPLNGPMIPFKNVTKALHGPVVTLLAYYSSRSHIYDRRKVGRVCFCVEHPLRRVHLSRQ